MSDANRRRGADAERAVVRYLRSMGWDNARRYLAGDGRQPGDIDFAPGVCLEVKDVASSAWPTWRAQCVAEAGGRIPVVVRRTRGVRDVGQWEAEVPVPVWFETLGGIWFDERGIWCRRTNELWHRTTFADVVALLAIEH